MLVQQLKERIVNEAFNLLAKADIKIALSSHVRTFMLKIFSPGPFIVGSMINYGYKGMSSQSPEKVTAPRL